MTLGSSVSTHSRPDRKVALQLVEDILAASNLYDTLGIPPTAAPEDIRRAYISRSRICHPDKLPDNNQATEAFQKISVAYETLSNKNSRKLYDCSGASADGFSGEETLSEALSQIFKEFMDGDFEHLLSIVELLNTQNPELNIDKEKANQLFVQVREKFIVVGKYLTQVKFEVMRLYEIQGELRSLSYLNVFGRLRLSIKLSRVFINIPVKLGSAVTDGKVANNQLCQLLGELTGLLELFESMIGKVDTWLTAQWPKILPLGVS
ncbi:DnaJ-domain-containing protein [Basidiobolus meristosporus CBS 931.73]|uniref:DnaJ-domain-containing protein n=1 Tax=Basidiobolus meristosporus CBS 931.73 TaxID=1314790 RepID=A0A1Y1YL55_9FUNG|nr:DnaJ-domain-containing protein [Basidiobolus meristosporus CBS 931.73]|eukprot:ORX98740.1 DnaJ-domain-containing protein [Basidiobolus meristosporus CBS 931.73]